MGEWLGPTDTWPPHSRVWDPYLARARSAGWWVRKFDDHSWGKVVCRVDPVDERCELLVFSSGRGGEAWAQKLGKLVDRCPHGTPASDTPPGSRAVARAAAHLDRAESLVRAATRLREAGEAEERAQELLGYAIERLEEGEAEALAEDSLAEAGIHEAEAAQLRATARGDLDATDAGLDEDQIVEAADEAVNAGARSLRTANPKRREVRDLVNKIRRLREEISKLRDSTT